MIVIPWSSKLGLIITPDISHNLRHPQLVFSKTERLCGHEGYFHYAYRYRDSLKVTLLCHVKQSITLSRMIDVSKVIGLRLAPSS